tara:strand:+ start:395 stop:517 length:123 start_codon:yes stop_codon:yes gene_type:complete
MTDKSSKQIPNVISVDFEEVEKTKLKISEISESFLPERQV